jgi:hypothetical protein
MNVRDKICKMLLARGCQLRTDVGIIYVTTPENVVWDMTVPQINHPETEILQRKPK